MSQPDGAAECAEALQKTLTPNRRIALAYLQKLWTALDNEECFMTQRQLAEQIDTIGETCSNPKSTLH
jgi:hypothetical protein